MVKLKKTLANLLLFMVALSIALFAGEGCVRLILPQDALLVRAYQRQHAELGYVAKSNFEYHDTKSMSLYNFEYTVRTNNMGLRMEAEVDPEKQSVLYLGDSFTFGWGVEIEESFFSLLTNSTTNSELQALNCGQGGYSTGHVSRRLELMTRQINVRKAIYFLNWNDVFDNASTDVNFRTHSYRRNEEGEMLLKDETVYTDFKRFLLFKTPYSWLNIHSHLFVLVKELAKGAKSKPADLSDDSPASEKNNAKLHVDQKDITMAHLNRLDRLCDDLGVELLVVFIPIPDDLVENDARVDLRGFPFSNLRESLPTYLSSLGVEYFDPTAYMQEKLASANDDERLIYYGEGHYNRLGNALFAEACQSKVQSFLGSAH